MATHGPPLTRRRFSILLGALALAAGRRAEAAEKGPALWAVTRDKATVFLFGQMPLRTDTVWLEPEIETAFTSSDVLWLENPDYSQTTPEVMDGVNALTRRNAPDPMYTVLQVLPPGDGQRLRKVLAEEGLQPDSLNGRAARDVRQLLSSVADRRSGADFKAIPEALFRKRALSAGKPIRTEWRDLLDVVSWGMNLPKATELDLVRMTLDDVEHVTDYPAELASWVNGDLKVQIATTRARARAYPELTARLGRQRNAVWAEKIRGMLTEEKTQFVCIGIAHLVEPDSVPELLRKAGLRVQGGPRT